MNKILFIVITAVISISANASSFYDDVARLIEPQDQYGKYVNCAAMATLLLNDTGNVKYEADIARLLKPVKNAKFNEQAIFSALNTRGAYFIGITDYHKQIYKKEFNLQPLFRQNCRVL
ncbi:TPA: hypothetical protein ACVO0J_004726 [Vibrio diabolicus]|uniref:hypothetical protein n=1 Tax=Vibrio TaxID=662 RepID=UPI00215FA03F|nr:MULTISPECIES: hypothetical protein [Vibrio]HCE2458170.1 hypothetical protein [Vibrio parahaemolyticus]MCS0048983.1 hypothetical protein [Vibrio antiquarius]MCS0204223.1 hypothetical protein [Vibrio sp. HS-50-1]MCS0410268.1 hypothetical protein [Vibrio diabolicus]MCZ0743310.1 hypothetical protein [Vibrio diabolicus]